MMMYRVPSQPSHSCSHFAAKNGSHSQGATLCLQGQSQTLLQLSRYKSKIDDNWRIVMSLALLLTNFSLLGNLILFSNNSLSGGNIIWTWMVLNLGLECSGCFVWEMFPIKYCNSCQVNREWILPEASLSISIIRGCCNISSSIQNSNQNWWIKR